MINFYSFSDELQKIAGIPVATKGITRAPQHLKEMLKQIKQRGPSVIRPWQREQTRAMGMHGLRSVRY